MHYKRKSSGHTGKNPSENPGPGQKPLFGDSDNNDRTTSEDSSKHHGQRSSVAFLYPNATDSVAFLYANATDESTGQPEFEGLPMLPWSFEESSLAVRALLSERPSMEF